jgi:hypothetical protein
MLPFGILHDPSLVLAGLVLRVIWTADQNSCSKSAVVVGVAEIKQHRI